MCKTQRNLLPHINKKTFYRLKAGLVMQRLGEGLTEGVILEFGVFWQKSVRFGMCLRGSKPWVSCCTPWRIKRVYHTGGEKVMKKIKMFRRCAESSKKEKEKR